MTEPDQETIRRVEQLRAEILEHNERYYVDDAPIVSDADYDDLVKELHSKEGLMDAYDAAVIHRREDGKVKITRKHETPTRVGGVLGGGAGLATGLVIALFPFAAVGGGRDRCLQ